MSNKCLRDGCDEGRLDTRGSLGRFCSDECLRAHRSGGTDTQIADAILAGLEESDRL